MQNYFLSCRQKIYGSISHRLPLSFLGVTSALLSRHTQISSSSSSSSCLYKSTISDPNTRSRKLDSIPLLDHLIRCSYRYYMYSSKPVWFSATSSTDKTNKEVAETTKISGNPDHSHSQQQQQQQQHEQGEKQLPTDKNHDHERAHVEVDPDQLRLDFIHCALSHVPAVGWSENAFIAASNALEISPAYHGIFSRGPVQLLEFHNHAANKLLSNAHTSGELFNVVLNEYDDQNRMGKEQGQEQRSSSTSNPDLLARKLEVAIKYRMKLNIAYHAIWANGLALQALPQNSLEGLKNLAHLVDEIAYICGDRSTDMSWYSNRLSIAAIYVSTELFWISDTSEDFYLTWDFLSRAVREYAQGKISLKNSLERLNQVGGAAITTLVSLINSKRRGY